jgi:hypothetical protein
MANAGSFKKGVKKPNQGKRGPGKATLNAREAIARLVDGNAERMQGWLDEIAAKEGALAAWKCMTDVIEYHIPKLQRTEHTGEGGGPMRVEAVEWTVAGPANNQA